MAPAPSATLGFRIDDSGLWGHFKISEYSSSGGFSGIPTAIKIVDGCSADARPVYLIPYDPAAGDNQDPEGLIYCTKILLERIFMHVLGQIGRAAPPEVSQISSGEVLKEIISEISSYWKASDLDKLKNRIRTEVFRVLNRGVMKGEVIADGEYVEISLRTPGHQDSAINMLLKTQTENIAKEMSMPKLGEESQLAEAWLCRIRLYGIKATARAPSRRSLAAARAAG